jgi:wyosine [tRNA(Phe)-imidazoG37] synthetase (radical SAM superfamily)
MSHVYGPVPSRRLGRSLGIDTTPLKTCNWNCVYCQLGRSTPVVNERQSYVDPTEILDELERTLQSHESDDIDWITFVASGETTLNDRLGFLIERVKAMTDIPVAVITNGTLLWRPEVRRELLAADAVLPTLDAGSSELYRRINRPHPELTFERHLEGLIAFRREFSGKLWIEVMLIAGMNDSEDALLDLRRCLDRIGPDAVHLLAPTRAPVEPWVEATDDEGWMRATAILGGIATVVPPIDIETALGDAPSVVDAVIDILTRHPMSEDQLGAALGRWTRGEAEATLEQLRATRRVTTVRRNGVVFWTAAEGVYPAA